MEGLRNNTVQYVPGVLKISKALILSPEDYDKLAEDISPEYPFLKLEQYLQFPITRLKPPHSFEYLFYEYAPPRKNPALEGLSGLSWPGPQCRWCTARLKTRIIDRYLRELKKEFEKYPCERGCAAVGIPAAGGHKDDLHRRSASGGIGGEKGGAVLLHPGQ